MNGPTFIGQAVRDVRFKTGCAVDPAARKVLKSQKANGGFSDEFLLWAIKEAERDVMGRGVPAPTDPSKAKRFQEGVNPLDIEVPVPAGGTFTRKRCGDLTRADAEAIGAWYNRAAETMKRRGKGWTDIAKHIPEGKTLAAVWDQVPSRLRTRITKRTTK